MSEALIIFAAWFIGSVVWLLIQVAVYLLIVKTHEAYIYHRDVVILGMIAAPVFTLICYFVSKLWINDLTWAEVVVWPLIVGWAFFVVLAGIHIAARIRGVLKEESVR